MNEGRPKISDVLALAEQAAGILLEMRQTAEVTSKPDGSLVTEADTACNALLVEGLSVLTPKIPVLAEENPEEENRRILESCVTFWTVDPLDVTANYIHGKPDYSVNIALIERGVPVLGVLWFPDHHDVYYTGDDGIAYRRYGNQLPQRLQVMSIEKVRTQPVSFRNPFTIAIRQREEAQMEAHQQPFIRPLISAGQRRACLVASGEALMASEAEGFCLWDTAPAFAIIRAAGGDMRTENGEQLSFTSLHLPAYTTAHPSLLSRLGPKTGELLNTPNE